MILKRIPNFATYFPIYFYILWSGISIETLKKRNGKFLLLLLSKFLCILHAWFESPTPDRKIATNKNFLLLSYLKFCQSYFNKKLIPDVYWHHRWKAMPWYVFSQIRLKHNQRSSTSLLNFIITVTETPHHEALTTQNIKNSWNFVR